MKKTPVRTHFADDGEERNPFHDIGNHINHRGATHHQHQTHAQAARRPAPAASTSGRLQLPDVTGLTAAVESPAKGGYDHYKYDTTGREAKLAEGVLVFPSLHCLHPESFRSISLA
jgi:hypothetical protein